MQLQLSLISGGSAHHAGPKDQATLSPCGCPLPRRAPPPGGQQQAGRAAHPLGWPHLKRNRPFLRPKRLS